MFFISVVRSRYRENFGRTWLDNIVSNYGTCYVHVVSVGFSISYSLLCHCGDGLLLANCGAIVDE